METHAHLAASSSNGRDMFARSTKWTKHTARISAYFRVSFIQEFGMHCRPNRDSCVRGGDGIAMSDIVNGSFEGSALSRDTRRRTNAAAPAYRSVFFNPGSVEVYVGLGYRTR